MSFIEFNNKNKKILIFIVIFFITINLTKKTYANFNSMDLEYGEPILLNIAEKIAQGSIDKAIKNNWKMAVAIVDTHGTLIFYKKMNNTQLDSSTISTRKAQPVVYFKRTTKLLETVITERNCFAMLKVVIQLL